MYYKITKLYIFAILALTLKIVVGNTHKLQGFTYLGSIPKSEDPSTMATYYLSINGETWTDARDTCFSMMGKLVSPFNPVEDDILRSFMIINNADRIIWTSARKSNNVWKWESRDTNMLWSNWHSSNCESNTGCASAFTNGCTWAWCSENCNTIRHYVCEY